MTAWDLQQALLGYESYRVLIQTPDDLLWSLRPGVEVEGEHGLLFLLCEPLQEEDERPPGAHAN